MATASKKAPAKTPAKKSAAAKPTAAETAQSNVPTPRAEASDAHDPAYHPSRHSAANPGMVEANTAGGGAAHDEGEAPVGGRMDMIGATKGAEGSQPGSAPLDGDELAKGDNVFSLDQAMALPVVTSGTPVKEMSESERETYWAKREKDARAEAKESNESKADDKKTDVTTITFPRRPNIGAFKDKHGRTMLVVRSGGKLGQMVSKLYKDVEVPA